MFNLVADILCLHESASLCLNIHVYHQIAVFHGVFCCETYVIDQFVQTIDVYNTFMVRTG